jgi:phosphohistidine phosphatase
MKTLLLMRHAKSSWAEPGRGDHSRPLNGRGRRAAEALGRWITDEGLIPDQVLCSDAARTRETWRRLDLPGTPDLDPALYHAEAETLLEAVRAARGDRVLVLGHNPGIADFVCRLTLDRPAHPRFAQYPTGATTVLDCDLDSWADLDWGLGALHSFVVPADLGVSRK